MDLDAQPANRFNELPNETQEFLSQLRGGDITDMKEGMELVRNLRTVGRFMRWVVLGGLAMLMGVVTLHDNILKVIGWLQPQK